MHDTAAHLVDRILPIVPYRQRVIAYPKWLRILLARDAGIMSKARNIFLASIFVWQRKQARKKGIEGRIGVGAISFDQRFGDSLNLSPHTHAVIPDGVFTIEKNKAIFHRIQNPRDDDVQRINERIVSKIRRMLEQKGLIREQEDSEEITPDTMDLLALTIQRTAQRKNLNNNESRPRSRLSSGIEGFSLQAGTHVHENDREGLEHLCGYGARPSIALTRLKRHEDGKYEYSLKYPLPNGECRLILTGQQMMARLALLVPRPKIHLIHYTGVFAANSNWRKIIVPKSLDSKCKHCNQITEEHCSDEVHKIFKSDCYIASQEPNPRERYLDWASLMKRVYGKDILNCSECGKPRKIIAYIDDPPIVRKILIHLGMPTTGPPRSPARPRPQLELFV